MALLKDDRSLLQVVAWLYTLGGVDAPETLGGSVSWSFTPCRENSDLDVLAFNPTCCSCNKELASHLFSISMAWALRVIKAFLKMGMSFEYGIRYISIVGAKAYDQPMRIMKRDREPREDGKPTL